MISSKFKFIYKEKKIQTNQYIYLHKPNKEKKIKIQPTKKRINHCPIICHKLNKVYSLISKQTTTSDKKKVFGLGSHLEAKLNESLGRMPFLPSTSFCSSVSFFRCSSSNLCLSSSSFRCSSTSFSFSSAFQNKFFILIQIIQIYYHCNVENSFYQLTIFSCWISIFRLFSLIILLSSARFRPSSSFHFISKLKKKL